VRGPWHGARRGRSGGGPGPDRRAAPRPTVARAGGATLSEQGSAGPLTRGPRPTAGGGGGGPRKIKGVGRARMNRKLFDLFN
jgi:hypothetical protein